MFHLTFLSNLYLISRWLVICFIFSIAIVLGREYCRGNPYSAIFMTKLKIGIFFSSYLYKGMILQLFN
uniref:Uncharacterized protein n=1 Tax=Arundo donax TaxID=35708 RepID=A0A0A9AI09_ARUDO